LKPYLAVNYIAINNTRAPLTDIRVREALSLSFDRETIATKVLKFEEEPAYSLVPPGVAGYPGGNAYAFKDWPHEQRIARARELMVQAGFGPEKRLKLGFITGNQPDSKRVSAAVQQMWKEIYVDIEISQLETKTVYNLMRQTDFDIGTAGWIADYNDAKNFHYLFRTDSNEMNYGKYSNPEFDRLMLESDQIKDEAERGQVLLRAEKIVMDDFAFIPNRFINVRHIVQPYVKGFVPNKRDAYRTRWLSVDRPAGKEPPKPSSDGQPSTDVAVTEEQSWGDWFASIFCSWFGIWCTAA
jgi:oligopeptide transport system substrate-binding protein